MTGPPKEDLREFLTVFVSTVGYPTLPKCLELLSAQDSFFQLKVIDHVAPLSSALQQMIDKCTTPYYVEVNEDMLLYPHAIRTLYHRISAMETRVAQYVCTLYDVHLEKVIYGIKIYRRDVVSKYPYRDVRGSEWDQIRRFRADGYLDVRVPKEGATRDSASTLGLHGSYWTPLAVYLRFTVLELKRRQGNRTHEWVKEAALMLLNRFLENRSETDFYALMGILAGSLARPNTEGREKDYRAYDQTPGFASLRRFVDDVEQGWQDGGDIRADRQEIDVLETPGNGSGHG